MARHLSLLPSELKEGKKKEDRGSSSSSFSRKKEGGKLRNKKDLEFQMSRFPKRGRGVRRHFNRRSFRKKKEVRGRGLVVIVAPEEDMAGRANRRWKREKEGGERKKRLI